MDYRHIGTYASKTDVPKGFLDVLIETPMVIKHYRKIPDGLPFTVDHEELCFGDSTIPLIDAPLSILVTPKHAIIHYPGKLIFLFHSGITDKVFISDSIFHCTGHWLINNKNAYLVDSAGKTVFTKTQTSVVGLLGTGDVLYLEKDSTTQDMLQGGEMHLAMESLAIRRVFAEDGNPLLICDDITIFSDTARIINVRAMAPVRCLLRMTDYLITDCPVILTKDHIFLIAGPFIGRKKHCGHMTHINPSACTVHNFDNCITICDIMAALCYATRIRVPNIDYLENILCFLVMNKLGIDNLLELIKINCKLNIAGASSEQHRTATSPLSYYAVLGRAYRRIDDAGKTVLTPHIDFEALTVDEMHYIIIYRPELLVRFIDLCISEERLFYLRDLIAFYQKTKRFAEIQLILLEKGLIITEYPGLERILDLEREEINIQENKFNVITNLPPVHFTDTWNRN